MSVYVSKQQYDKACSVDLYDFLIRMHGSSVKQKYGSALLLADQHVSVRPGFHGYRNFRTGETGNNVDYLMNFLGYDYQGAVLALIGEICQGNDPIPVVNPTIPRKKGIDLPKPLDGRYRNLYAFLTARKIPADVIQLLIDRGLLYQSEKWNNVIFVSPQGDYCELRGTNSYADHRCRKRNECERYSSADHRWCSQMAFCQDYKPDPFHGCRKTRPDRFWYFDPKPGEPSEYIYICEAAIDAVSLYVIHQRKKNNGGKSVYVSIGGVANQQAIDRLVRGSKHRKVVLAVDNDQAGQDCRDRNPDLAYVLPKNKDWNDDLKKGDY